MSRDDAHDPCEWNPVRNERKLRSLTRQQVAKKIGIRESAATRTERDLPLNEADERKLRAWLREIGLARLRRLKKLEQLAQLAASLPPELGEAAVISLAENHRTVLAACRAGDPERQAALYRWTESVESAWESDGGLLRAEGHPDVR